VKLKRTIIVKFILIILIMTFNFCIPENNNPITIGTFSTKPGYEKVKIDWVNPTDTNFEKVVIRKSETAFPQTIGEGTAVYDGTDITFIDNNLTNGKIYYYSIFAVDKKGTSYTPTTSQVTPSDDYGAFLVVNSYGKGDMGWEHIPDGRYWVTFAAAKKKTLYAGMWEPQTENSEVKATINFKITHPYRGDFNIYLGVGDPANPIKQKYFIQLLLYPDDTLGNYPFPNNNIHLDISEFYPYMNNNNVYIKIKDRGAGNENGHSDTGTIDSIGLKIWTTTPYGNGSTPDLEYNIAGLPANTVNDTDLIYTFTAHQGNIPTTKKTGNQTTSAYYTRTIPPKEAIESFKEQFGTYEKGKNYNKIVNGFGTGAVPPTEEQWKKMENKQNYITPISTKTKQIFQEFIDNSASIHFPPIANQGDQGSCNAFVDVYYIHTFYTATLNNWDLSGCSWKNDNIDGDGCKSKVMNPDFVYNIMCSGNNIGITCDDGFEMLRLFGTTTFEYPYDDTDWTSWPTEASFINAPNNKYVTNEEDVNWYILNSNEYIELLMGLLEDGIIVHTFVDGYTFGTLSDKDVWTKENIPSSWTLNHGNTIVGFKTIFDPENP